MQKTRMILAGGFLGAGKTTLLARAAALLLAQGLRVSLITNDQAADLVDTAFLREARLDVLEIAGGCFCCRFGQLIETAQQLMEEMSPDIIIAEPVGSCTDISATVLQPMKDLYAETIRLTPFSVLVDPKRLWEVLEPRRQSPLHASARYILRKQLEEADFIVINKQDLLDEEERQELLAAAHEAYPGTSMHLISALTGDGVDGWLDAVLREERAGTHIVEVDYDVYAEGEALLGWVNAAATITTTADVDWQAIGLGILTRIQQALGEQRAEIAHVKLSLTTARGQYVGNLTSSTGTPAIRGCIDGTPRVASLVINARVEMSPEELQRVVEDVLRTTANAQLTIRLETLHSLSPGRPMPTHRYTSLV